MANNKGIFNAFFGNTLLPGTNGINTSYDNAIAKFIALEQLNTTHMAFSIGIGE